MENQKAAQDTVSSPKPAIKPPQDSFFARPVVHLLLIALVGLLAYANTFHVPFILDDEGSILNNHVIKDLGNFLSGAGYSYNPRRFIGYLTVALNYRFGGFDVTGYHIFNLVIHITTAWLVYALVRLTLQTPFFAGQSSGRSIPASELAASNSGSSPPAIHCLPSAAFIPLFTALIFIAHPVQTQAVTYVIQRLASLTTMFFLLSLVMYAWARLLQESGQRFSTGKVIGLNILSLATAGCAMKTKEIAFTLPFIVLLYEFFFFKMTARKKLIFLLPVVLTVLIVPLSLVGTGKPIGELISDITEKTRVQTNVPRLDYLLTQFRVIVTYIRLIFLPINQNLDYDFPIYRTFLTLPVFLSFLLILALLILALYLYVRSAPRPHSGTMIQRNDQLSFTVHHLRLISFGILWFFITLSVESSVIPIIDVIFEHRLYLPSVGAFIALATLAAVLLRNAPPRLVIFVAATVVLILGGATFARNQVWKNELRLWSDVVQKSPEKARPHYNLALALNKRGRIDEAFHEATIAVRLAPEEANPHNLIGSIFGRKGMYDKAVAELTEATRLDPESADPHVNLGDAYRLQGLAPQALEQYFIAMKLTPTDADVYNKIGLAYDIAGNREKAEIFFRCAVSLNPSRPDYSHNLQRAKEANPPPPSRTK